MTFQNLLARYRAISFSERDKGARFERLMAVWLKTAPPYADLFSHVWLWHDFPFRKQFGGKDTGIDLVAQTVYGDYWAIQCKCYDEKARIDMDSLGTFITTSSATFINERHERVGFERRLWISTTNNWTPEAEKAIQNLNPPFSRIGLAELAGSSVNWEELEKGAHGVRARKPRKKPFEHQQRAISAFNEYFRQGARGKLIMACGTGKTFTALKIAEQETGSKGHVLFLAPSIALIGQTLGEWSEQAEGRIFPICVCSDPEVSKRKDADADGMSVVDLGFPASTSVSEILRQFNLASKFHQDGLTVIFSTYQSIDAISKAQKQSGCEFDLIICDEAHRTTGVTLKGEDESAFVKVHDNNFIRARKRLYMTATPRLYHPEARKKAADAEAILCSMDDEKLYGPEVFRIGFGEAVDKSLLSDYKVLVLTVSEKDIPEALQSSIADENQEISTDDASKLIGCINALSKRMLIDEGLLKTSDPSPMAKAVAFCQTIKASRKISAMFNDFKDAYYDSLAAAEREEIVDVRAEHIDGTMGASMRQDKLDWLESSPAGGKECRILTNVRCLSEGVDVPSLDAVLFLSARDSQIDVVQSVGRVMRTAPGKKFGYIIIPVLIPSDVTPEQALNDNERFKVVWRVLNALRAHDDRFQAEVLKISLNRRKPTGGGSVIVGGVGGGSGEEGGNGDSRPKQAFLPLPRIEGLQNAIYARMVQKVGERRYWEQWAADVARIAEGYIERISRLIERPGPHREEFEKFLAALRNNINPDVTPAEVVEMLAQHYITKPVFEALFANYSFVKSNPVSQALQGLMDLLERQALEKDAVVLSRFYESVKMRVSGIDNPQGRQKIITELYDRFFRTAFPKTVERLGIVYTPVEIVDFINQSVADILREKFGRSISDPDVNILDPFAGTGTFMARLIESGLIDHGALPEKYERNLFANEIVLLAYYIASVNIENAFHGVMGEETAYRPFNGICLTDTFQLGEADGQAELDTPFLRRNSERVQREEKTAIQVIIGNPPYSVGQKSANDNAQNQKYDKLESRIAATYAARSKVNLKKALYDSYIKAFRWASDRIDAKAGGIVAFVCNAGWLDGNAMDGMRKCLAEEFSEIYIFNLRGNQRTSGETSRREGGKIFGSGSRTPISITILIKIPGHKGKATIRYRDIGDYLTREDKLAIIARGGSILSDGMNWEILEPDERGDWINHGNRLFESFIILGDKDDKGNLQTFFKPVYSLGLATNRDAWCYNFSKAALSDNINRMIGYYSNELKSACMDYPFEDTNEIKWTRGIKKLFAAKREITFNNESIYIGLYRPYTKEYCYFNAQLNEMVLSLESLFPTPEIKNEIICVSGIGANKGFASLISQYLPNLDTVEKAQCFPLYYYEKKSVSHPTLFDAGKDEYARKDAISDFILERCQENYGPKVTREDIFYYVYGLLHSPDYRAAFANDLKKSLPRLPLVEKPKDFCAFSKAGLALADLHLNYEAQPPCLAVKIEGLDCDLPGFEKYHVERMRFADKNDKSVIQYNSWITLSNIPPAAYEYVVNGRSAIEWIMERYQITKDSKSGIKNDPNDWAREHDKPSYILDLLLSMITVSLETMKIVNGLPKLEFEESGEDAE